MFNFKQKYKFIGGKNGLIVFAPFKEYGQEDGVRIVADLLKNQLSKFKHVISLHKQKKESIDFLKNCKIKKMAFFAHPKLDTADFLLDSDCDKCLIKTSCTFKPACKIIPEMYSNGTPYKTLFAHVCKGAEILRNDKWKQTFPNWVSFDGDIFIYYGSNRQERIWTTLFKRIFTYTFSTKNSKALREYIDSAYSEEMGKIYENYNGLDGDALLLMHMNQAKKLLTNN